MKTELTPEVLEAEIRLLNLHQQRLHDWANSIREQISQKDKKRLSLLTKQDKQPQANDVGKFPKSTWEVDALRRKVKRLEEEIKSLKKANAELVKELSDICLMARSLGWHEATTGRQIILDSAEELLKKLSKHDKQ